MADHRRNPLTPQDAEALAPLDQSHDANEVDRQLKLLFMQMFETHIRPGAREVATAGMPHIGPFGQVERAVKAEGLAMYRAGDEAALRYLFRAWRARNPKRGFGLLKTYLQLLWPNGWEVHQLWQQRGLTYPTQLEQSDLGNHWRTSRVQVFISSGTTSGADVASIAPSLRTVIPARALIDVAVLTRSQMDVAMAAGYYRGAAVHYFTGSFA